MNSDAHIVKYAAVIIDEKGRYLIVKDEKEVFWKNVGGKPEADETPETCLKREIQEELNVVVKGNPVYYFSCPVTPTASDPKKSVQIILYTVNIEGKPSPSSEIGELHWLTFKEFINKKYKLTQQIQDYIVPRLISDGYLK